MVRSSRRASRSRVRPLRLGGLVVIAALVLAACGSGGSSSSSGGGSGSGATASSTPLASSPLKTLIIANSVKPDTLDPAANSINEAIWLDQNIYSRLFQPNSTGTGVIDDLATGYKVSSNHLVYTFKIRKAEFSNGMPVTAADIVFSWERAIHYSGGWGFLLTAVKTVRALNSRTVQVTLSQPHAPLIADLAMFAYSVLPESLVKKEGKAFFNHPIGSGPFEVTSNTPSGTDLKASPKFYGTKPKIENVDVNVVPNANTRVLLLNSGKADVIEDPPANLVSSIDAAKKAAVDLFPSTQVNFIAMDEHYAPFKKQLVRQALNYAIDRSAIVKLSYQGHATPGSSFLPLDMKYYDSSLKPYPYDPAKAKKMLAQAGYPNGFNAFMITVSGDSTGAATAVLVQQELAKVGVKVSIQSYEETTAYAKEDGGHSELGERYWTNDIIDPDEVATFGAQSNGGGNAFNTYWKDTQVDKDVTAARSELSTSKRQRLYDQVQQAVYQQSPYLVTAYSPYLYGVGDWVHGFHVTPLGNYDLSLETLTVSKH